MVTIHEVRWKTASVTRNNLVAGESFVLSSCSKEGHLEGSYLEVGVWFVWIHFTFVCEVGSHKACATQKTYKVAEMTLNL